MSNIWTKFKNLWNPAPEVSSKVLLKRQETLFGILSEDFVPINEVQDVTDRILQTYNSCSNERVIVGIAGRPGSGKTCFANVIANSILDRTNNDIRVAVMPIDRYYLYREELERMPDPELAIARRGVYWTYNPEKLYNDLVQIANAKNGKDIKVPSFDHDLKDPKENDIIISKNAQIVIVEGNYLFCKCTTAWRKVCEMFNLKIFLECDPMECMKRLANSSTEKTSINDGDLVDSNKGNADLICHSINKFLLENDTLADPKMSTVKYERDMRLKSEPPF